MRRSLAPGLVALLRPREQCLAPHAPRSSVFRYERPVWETCDVRSVRFLYAWFEQPIAVQLQIDRICAGWIAEATSPDRAEASKVFAPAFGTRPMAGRERRDFIEEEELGIAVRGHDGPPDALPFQPACDPSPELRVVHDAPRVIVEYAAVAHEQAASLERGDIAKRRDPVLQRHLCTFFMFWGLTFPPKYTTIWLWILSAPLSRPFRTPRAG